MPYISRLQFFKIHSDTYSKISCQYCLKDNHLKISHQLFNGIYLLELLLNRDIFYISNW